LEVDIKTDVQDISYGQTSGDMSKVQASPMEIPRSMSDVQNVIPKFIQQERMEQSGCMNVQQRQMNMQLKSLKILAKLNFRLLLRFL